MITPDQILPSGWRDLIIPGAKTTIGYDIATTEGDTSNPASIAITQQVANRYQVKVGATWKTKDPDIARAVIAQAFDLPHGLRPFAFVIDASNERYFATDLQRAYARKTKVVLYVANESIEFRGEKIPLKTYCGNLCKNAIQDGQLDLPPEEWVYRNFRGVKEDKGRFVFEADAEGNHCDFVQAVWNCLYGFAAPGSGPVSAKPSGTISQRVWGALQTLSGRIGQPTPRLT